MEDLESLGLRVRQGRVELLDQTRLPDEERWIELDTPEKLEEAIRSLRVRGAPLIGVCAAVCLPVFARKCGDADAFRSVALRIREARPTAVNLMAAVDRMLEVLEPGESPASGNSVGKLEERALSIFREDVELCRKMGENGLSLIGQGETILTHCNTGGLATAGSGTALAVIRAAHEAGRKIHVYVDETRPLLQGARLTAWELERLGVPYTLICDNAAGSLMRAGKVRRVITGADRIARNGDFANKVGTYSLAVLCKHHGIPFHVAAPETTLDRACPSGSEIPVEQRPAAEVRGFSGSAGSVRWAPASAPAANPAFDVTPAGLVHTFILDSGVYGADSLPA